VIGNPNYLKLPNCTLVDFLKTQILLHHPFSSKSFPPFRQETKKLLVKITVEETKVGMNLLYVEWEVCCLAIEKAAEHHHEQVLGHYYYYYHTTTTLTTSSYPTLLEKAAEAQMMSKFNGKFFLYENLHKFSRMKFLCKICDKRLVLSPSHNSTLQFLFPVYVCLLRSWSSVFLLGILLQFFWVANFPKILTS
jgi:hypothetical protein